MVDIRLISILPTQTAQGVQASPISQGTGGQTPGPLLNLPAGNILSGFIINRDPAGNPILRTPQGDITFKSDIFLKIGAEVVIRLVGTKDHTEARILSIDGKPPPEQPARPASTAEPGVTVSRTAPETPASSPRTPATPQSPAQISAPTPSTPPVTTARAPVNGVVVAPPPPTTPGAANPPVTLPTGTQITVNVVSVTPATEHQLATIQQPVAPPTATNTPYAAYTRTAGATVAIPPAAPPPVAATATPLSATVAPPPAPSLAGQTVTAIVVGHEPGGETLVQLPQGVVRLQTGAALPQGSKVTLHITQTTPPAPALATGTPLPAPLTEIAYQWSSLQQIAELLAARDGMPLSAPWLPALSAPAASTTAGAAVTPQTIASGLLFFLAALRGGDFNNWLGQDNVRWLQQNGHEALARKAQAEFVQMGRPFSEAPAPATTQSWQTLIFPFVASGHWQQARVFVKRDREHGKNARDKKSDDTRFIVEVTLSQLGDLQMDGFVRRQQKATEFDLVIRSRSPLDDAMQQHILGIYSDMGELTGYQGNLVFQAVREFPVRPLEEIVAEHTGGVIA